MAETDPPRRKRPPTELSVIAPAGLNGGEQLLLATLQGVLNRTQATVWIRSGELNAILLEQLQGEGVRLNPAGSVWELLARHRASIDGLVLCQLDDESVNVATSLSGLLNAVAVDQSLVEKAGGFGLTVLADARTNRLAELIRQTPGPFNQAMAVHQPVGKVLHLRDWAVMNRAFTFATEDAAQRRRWLRAMGRQPFVYGWGEDERRFVDDVTQAGGVVVPADWSLNLSALFHLPADLPQRAHKPPSPPRHGERVVAFVMSDGDNIQWMGGGFATHRGFWASPHRGKLRMTWEAPPVLGRIAPRTLAHLYRTATEADGFVAGPSGAGYYFPARSPEKAAWAKTTAKLASQAGLRIVSVLNSGGSMADTREILDQGEVDGVLYKDFHPYNKERGRIFWHRGKPCVSYRFLLWEPREDQSPKGVAAAIARLPAEADRNPDSYALVNVHA